MKSFRFSLQRVLDVRVLQEERQQRALAAARAKADAVDAELEEARSRRAAAVKEDGSRPGVDPWLLELAWRRRTRLSGQVRKLADELSEARRIEDEERQALIVRHKERRVLERLAEKQRREHERERLRREQALLDEAAAQRRRRLWTGGANE